jgi:hypothetical protein
MFLYLNFPKVLHGESSSKYRLLELDLNAIKAELNKAVYDSDPNAFINGPEISLPLPEGGFADLKLLVQRFA